MLFKWLAQVDTCVRAGIQRRLKQKHVELPGTITVETRYNERRNNEIRVTTNNF